MMATPDLHGTKASNETGKWVMGGAVMILGIAAITIANQEAAAPLLSCARIAAAARRMKAIVDIPVNTPVQVVKTIAFQVEGSDVDYRASGKYPVDGS